MTHILPILLAQAENNPNPEDLAALIAGIFFLVICVPIGILIIAGMWTAFEKAGEPGWASLIPIYNYVVMAKIAGRPLWWILLMFVPCVGYIVLIVLTIDFAKAYGKDVMFGLGLAFLPMIFFPILGFGSARYIGPQVDDY